MDPLSRRRRTRWRGRCKRPFPHFFPPSSPLTHVLDLQAVCSVALRADGSGLLISASRSISQPKDKAAAARELRDVINASRAQVLEEHIHKKPRLAPAHALLPYQDQFITFALANNVLQFGSFKLKSGRVSPYFFNAGLFCSGDSLNALSR